MAGDPFFSWQPPFFRIAHEPGEAYPFVSYIAISVSMVLAAVAALLVGRDRWALHFFLIFGAGMLVRVMTYFVISY